MGKSKGGKSKREITLSPWALSQWSNAQGSATQRARSLEEAAATDSWKPGGQETEEILAAYRQRRAVGLARAKAITQQKAMADGEMTIPLLLLTMPGSLEERQLLGYNIAPPAEAPADGVPARNESDPDECAN